MILTTVIKSRAIMADTPLAEAHKQCQHSFRHLSGLDPAARLELGRLDHAVEFTSGSVWLHLYNNYILHLSKSLCSETALLLSGLPYCSSDIT